MFSRNVDIKILSRSEAIVGGGEDCYVSLRSAGAALKVLLFLREDDCDEGGKSEARTNNFKARESCSQEGTRMMSLSSLQKVVVAIKCF
jgi:hypothetical protein